LFIFKIRFDSKKQTRRSKGKDKEEKEKKKNTI